MIGRMLLVGFVATLGVARLSDAGDEILEMGAKEWKYWDKGEEIPKDWHSAEFDDSEWKSGQAPLGYGDDDIKQEISFGDDPNNKHLVSLFRRTVEIEDPSNIKKVLGEFNCDDGCVIYINGKEVHRHNLPEGELTDKMTSSFTISGELERYKLSFLADADKLKAGKNVIAVRVHQRGAVSSDLAIDLALTALVDDEEIQEATSRVEEEAASLKALTEGGF